MTWWAWTLLWAVLVLGSLWVFFVLGRSLWRKASDLLAELGTASERLAEVSAQLDALGDRPPVREEPAVFADPAELRRERAAHARRQARAGRGRTAGR
jgi:hypothetical protein